MAPMFQYEIDMVSTDGFHVLEALKGVGFELAFVDAVPFQSYEMDAIGVPALMQFYYLPDIWVC